MINVFKDFTMLPKSVLNKKEFNFEDEITYRKNSNKVESVTKFSEKTGRRVQTIHYDYFNPSKIKSIDEFDENSGIRLRTITFSLFKSVTEYDIASGKKLRTINYNMRDESKISSIHEYNLEYGRISKVSVFRNDGKTISMIKELNPETEMIEKCINYKKDSNVISSVTKYYFDGNKTVKTTMYYNGFVFSRPKQTKQTDFGGFRPQTLKEKVKTDKLIDNLFKNKLTFSMLS